MAYVIDWHEQTRRHRVDFNCFNQAMQKISTNYLNKKMPPIHELNHDEINQQW